jgi:hypothetical protein
MKSMDIEDVDEFDKEFSKFLEERNISEKAFKKTLYSEMFVKFAGLKYGWNKYNKILSPGFIVLRFKRNVFILCCYDEKMDIVETCILPFLLNNIKTVYDFNKSIEICDIKSLIKMFGRPTHWRPIDLQLPRYWKK